MKLLFLATACLFFMGIKPIPKSDIIDPIQKAWDEVKAYQAHYKQVVFSKRMGTRDESEGTIYVKKPGRLRWENAQDLSIQILHGVRLWNITENARRKTKVVDYYKDISTQTNMQALAFLSARSNLKKTYHFDILTDSPEKLTVKMITKTTPPDTYIAEILKPSYFLAALTTETVDTRVRIDFSDIKNNVALEDGLFEYKAGPKDVVHEN